MTQPAQVTESIPHTGRVQFVKHPPRKHVPSPEWLLDAVEELKARPREWGMVNAASSENTAKKQAQAFRSGQYAALRGGLWDGLSRGLDVYARYLGEDGTYSEDD